MERIDELENTVLAIRNSLAEVAEAKAVSDELRGKSQNLKDKEIVEFIESINQQGE